MRYKLKINFIFFYVIIIFLISSPFISSLNNENVIPSEPGGTEQPILDKEQLKRSEIGEPEQNTYSRTARGGNGSQDPSLIELSNGLWCVKWNFTNNSAYTLNSMVLDSGSAQLNKTNNVIYYDIDSGLKSGVHDRTTLDYLNRLSLDTVSDYRFLISDFGNNRVLELDELHRWEWQYGQNGTSGNTTGYLNGTKSVVVLPSSNLLVTDTNNHRVIEINRSTGGSIDWFFGENGVNGSGSGKLDKPSYSTVMASGNILIADTNNHKVCEINKNNKNKVWSYGTGSQGWGNNQLSSPASAVPLKNGTILIADRDSHRVILVDYSNKKILWEYGDPGNAGSDDGLKQLNSPGFAQPLDSGNLLITDTINHRILEVNMNKDIVWQYGITGISGFSNNFLELPRRAYQSMNGNIIIVDTGNHRVLEVTKSKSIVRQYGGNKTPGNGENRLDTPFDIGFQEVEYLSNGDYTSSVIDAGDSVLWTEFQAVYTTPAETELKFYFRFGNISTPDSSWTQWDGPYSSPNVFLHDSSGERYVQFRTEFSTTNITKTATLTSISLKYQEFETTGSVVLNNFNNDNIIKIIKFIPEVVENGEIINYYYSLDKGKSWTEVPVNNSLEGIGLNGNGIQFKVDLISTDPVISPVINSISMELTMFGDLKEIIVVPGSLTIRAGDVFIFNAIGTDKQGNRLDITPIWSTTVGTMSGSTFVAQTATGTGFVNASVEDVVGTCIVNITHAELFTIKVKPFEIDVQAGGSQEFHAVGFDIYANEVPITATWSSTIGKMEGNRFKAGFKEESGIVFANNGSIYGFAFVNVIFNIQHPPPEIHGTIPNQVYPEDSQPWQLQLTPFEFDLEDSGTDLNWYVTGETNELFDISGEYDPSDVLTFIPRPNAFGSAKITLWLEDSMGFTDSKDLWVNLTPVNDKPLIKSIPDLQLKKGSEYWFDFSPYISDIDHPDSELTIYTFSSMGQNYISMDGYIGKINYPSNYDKNQDIITITVSDGSEFSEDLFLINFTANAPPKQNPLYDMPGTATFWEDSSLTLVGNINDFFIEPDGEPLHYKFDSEHIKGEVLENGKLILSSKKPNWFGSDMIIIKAFDQKGAFSSVSVDVIVKPVNDPPIFNKIPEINIHYEKEYAFDLTPFVFDADNSTSDLTVSTNDRLNIKNSLKNNMVLLMNYSIDMLGFVMKVNITVSDGLNKTSENISIFIFNEFPPMQKKAFQPAQFFEDTKLRNYYKLDDYFTDPDSALLEYEVINETILVEINNDNYVDIWAPENWFGTEKITFVAKDENNFTYYASAMITVIPVNDKPIITDIPHQSGEVDSLWVMDLKPYVYDPDNRFEELSFELEKPKGYAILHGSSILFNYDSVLTEALTVEVSDNIDQSAHSFVVQFLGQTQEIEVAEPEDQTTRIYLTLSYILILIVTINGGLISYIYVKYKGRFKLEDLFLIHANGNLISHVGGGSREYSDNEILSGMLTAIQDFIKDGFSGGSDSGDDWSLDHLKFGDRNIFIERGDYMYIAAVFTGRVGWKLRKELRDALKEIDSGYSSTLKDWSGLIDDITGINSILKNKFKLFEPKAELTVYERDISFIESEIYSTQPSVAAAEPRENTAAPASVEPAPAGTEKSPVPETTETKSEKKVSLEQEGTEENKRTTEKLEPAENPADDSDLTASTIPENIIMAVADAPPAGEYIQDTGIKHQHGTVPKLPRNLTSEEKGKLPKTKPVNDYYSNNNGGN